MAKEQPNIIPPSDETVTGTTDWLTSSAAASESTYTPGSSHETETRLFATVAGPVTLAESVIACSSNWPSMVPGTQH